MLGLSCVGAVIAAAYGIIHDQVTYSIAPEYFTRLKFEQFHYADFGLPARVFVAEIGALATWWIGFAGGWFMARVIVPRQLPLPPLRYALRGFLIMLGCAFVAGVSGFAYGLSYKITTGSSGLAAAASELGVRDIPAFVRVAYIHNAGYLGGLAGLIVALLVLRHQVRADELGSLPTADTGAKE